MEWELSSAEQTRNLSFALVIAGPLIMLFIGRIVIGIPVPVATDGLDMTKYGTQRITKISESAPRKAASGAARLTRSAMGKTKERPSCAEIIKPHARVCHHCGRDVV